MGTALPAPAALSAPGLSRAQEVHRLRREISRMQRRRSDAATLPLDPALTGLLADDGLRTGAAYSVSPSPSLLGALLSAPSRQGTWCAAVGMPTLGAEAMAGFGVDLSRLVLVPEPGERWLAVVSALADVVPLIAVHPRGRVADAEIQRLGARLRDRGCTLLVTGRWPQSEATIRVTDAEWHGLGAGHGLLSERTVTLQSFSRGILTPSSIRVRLPGALGRVDAAPAVRPLAPLTPLPVPASTADAATGRSEESWAVAG